GERPLHLRQGTVLLVQYADADDHQTRPAQEPGDGRRGARPATEAIPDHHRQVESGRPGQELSEREQLHKLLLREPALLLDQRASRPEHHTAKTRQGNPGKGEEQREPADARFLEFCLLHGFLTQSIQRDERIERLLSASARFDNIQLNVTPREDRQRSKRGSTEVTEFVKTVYF